MNDAISRMLAKYRLETLDDHLRALREILQEIALLGLWRSKFFEHGAFCGGTALRILHGLDRFSEDLDFSLLAPTPGFETEARYVLNPIPFAVRAYTLPDLFAGKMHAVLCRRWKTRTKGRDWYDLVWFVAHHPRLNLSHLKARMVQTGDWPARQNLTAKTFQAALRRAIELADIAAARREVVPFVPRPDALEVWSPHFFLDLARRIECV